MKKAISILCVIFCSSFFLAATDNLKLFNKAQSLYESDKYDEALIIYEKLLSVESKDIGLIEFNTASTYYKLGQYEKAIDLYLRAKNTISIKEDNLYRVYYNLGNAYYRVGKISKALEYYLETLKENPSYLDAKYNIEFISRKKKEAFRKFYEDDLKDVLKKAQEKIKKQDDQKKEKEDNLKKSSLNEKPQMMSDEPKAKAKVFTKIKNDNKGKDTSKEEKKDQPDHILLILEEDSDIVSLVYNQYKEERIRNIGDYDAGDKSGYTGIHLTRIFTDKGPLVAASSRRARIDYLCFNMLFSPENKSELAGFNPTLFMKDRGHTGSVTEVVSTLKELDSNNKLLASTSADHTIRFFSIDTGTKRIQTYSIFREIHAPIKELIYLEPMSENNDLFFCASTIDSLNIVKFNCETKEADLVSSISFSARNRLTCIEASNYKTEKGVLIYAGFENGDIGVVEATADNKIKLIKKTKVHRGKVNDILQSSQLTKEGQPISVSVSDDKKVIFFTLNTATSEIQILDTFNKSRSSIKRIDYAFFDPQIGKYIYMISSSDFVIRFIEFNSYIKRSILIDEYKTSQKCIAGYYVGIAAEEGDGMFENEQMQENASLSEESDRIDDDEKREKEDKPLQQKSKQNQANRQNNQKQSEKSASDKQKAQKSSEQSENSESQQSKSSESQQNSQDSQQSSESSESGEQSQSSQSQKSKSSDSQQSSQDIQQNAESGEQSESSQSQQSESSDSQQSSQDSQQSAESGEQSESSQSQQSESSDSQQSSQESQQSAESGQQSEGSESQQNETNESQESSESGEQSEGSQNGQKSEGSDDEAKGSESQQQSKSSNSQESPTSSKSQNSSSSSSNKSNEESLSKMTPEDMEKQIGKSLQSNESNMRNAAKQVENNINDICESAQSEIQSLSSNLSENDSVKTESRQHQQLANELQNELNTNKGPDLSKASDAAQLSDLKQALAEKERNIAAQSKGLEDYIHKTADLLKSNPELHSDENLSKLARIAQQKEALNNQRQALNSLQNATQAHESVNQLKEDVKSKERLLENLAKAKKGAADKETQARLQNAMDKTSENLKQSKSRLEDALSHMEESVNKAKSVINPQAKKDTQGEQSETNKDYQPQQNKPNLSMEAFRDMYEQSQEKLQKSAKDIESIKQRTKEKGSISDKSLLSSIMEKQNELDTVGNKMKDVLEGQKESLLDEMQKTMSSNERARRDAQKAMEAAAYEVSQQNPVSSQGKEMQKQVAQNQEDIDNLNNELATVIDDFLRAKQAHDLPSAKSKMQEYESNQSDLKNKFENQNKALEDFIKSSEIDQSAKDRINALRQRAHEAVKASSSMQNQNKMSEDTHKKAEEIANMESDLKKQLSQMENQLSSLQKEQQKASADRDIKNALNNTSQTLNQSIQNATNSNNKEMISEALKQASQNMSEVSSKQKDKAIDSLQAAEMAADTIEKSQSSLQDKLLKAAEADASLQNQVNDKVKKSQEIQGEVDKLKDKIDKVKKKIEKDGMTNTDHEQMASDINETAENIKKALEQQKTENQSLKSNNSSAAKSLNEAQESSSDSQKAAQSLKEATQEVSDTIQEKKQAEVINEEIKRIKDEIKKQGTNLPEQELKDALEKTLSKVQDYNQSDKRIPNKLSDETNKLNDTPPNTADEMLDKSKSIKEAGKEALNQIRESQDKADQALKDALKKSTELAAKAKESSNSASKQNSEFSKGFPPENVDELYKRKAMEKRSENIKKKSDNLANKLAKLKETMEKKDISSEELDSLKKDIESIKKNAQEQLKALEEDAKSTKNAEKQSKILKEKKELSNLTDDLEQMNRILEAAGKTKRSKNEIKKSENKLEEALSTFTKKENDLMRNSKQNKSIDPDIKEMRDLAKSLGELGYEIAENDSDLKVDINELKENINKKISKQAVEEKYRGSEMTSDGKLAQITSIDKANLEKSKEDKNLISEKEALRILDALKQKEEQSSQNRKMIVTLEKNKQNLNDW